VDFPTQMQMEKAKLMAWPQFIQFPEDSALRGRRALVVDDVWGSGRTITAVKIRVAAAGGFPSTCVMHFNPYRNLFGPAKPDFYAAITDAHIIYPWEINRGPDKVRLPELG
jgi:hypoxanthine phosphoribosyltransferase